MRIPFLFAAVLTMFLATAVAHPAPPASPVVTAIEPFIAQNEIAGAVTLVAEYGQIVSFETVGLANVAGKKSMKKNSVFWIASMTKPMTGVAVLMLQDEGKLNVTDRVDKYLPEFSTLWLVDEKSEDKLVLDRPARPITLKDLLTHTAGIPNVDAPRAHSTLAEVVSLASRQPLQFEPGSKWSYSNAGIDTLGRIVEVVSGQSFNEFLQERLFKPLKMKSTSFHPSRGLAKRLAKTYQKNEQSGELEETSIYFVNGDLWDKKRTVRPAGGLFSTAEDLYNFYQMMLYRGAWEGKRLLSESAVEELTKTQTGDITTGFTEGMSWGLGFQVVKNPTGVTGMLSPGTFGHGGAYATQSWADPNREAIFILMVQRRGFPNGDNSEVRKAFQSAAVGMLGK